MLVCSPFVIISHFKRLRRQNKCIYCSHMSLYLPGRISYLTPNLFASISSFLPVGTGTQACSGLHLLLQGLSNKQPPAQQQQQQQAQLSAASSAAQAQQIGKPNQSASAGQAEVRDQSLPVSTCILQKHCVLSDED